MGIFRSLWGDLAVRLVLVIREAYSEESKLISLAGLGVTDR